MNAILARLARLDARAWRALAVGFVLFGGVGLMVIFGAAALGLSGEKGMTALRGFLGAGLPAPLALPAAVAGFSILAFLGVPQLVLIAAAVAVFGPWLGMAYSWVGTEVSALIGFFLGRRFGAGLLRDHGGKWVNDLTRMIGQNGLIATLIVRQAPLAPFIFINVAAGLTPMRLSVFALGTGLGIIPKIAVTGCLTAFAGRAAAAGAGHGAGSGLLTTGLGLAVTIAVWAASGLAAQGWLRRRQAATSGADSVDRAAEAGQD